jgi:hypothetical protein
VIPTRPLGGAGVAGPRVNTSGGTGPSPVGATPARAAARAAARNGSVVRRFCNGGVVIWPRRRSAPGLNASPNPIYLAIIGLLISGDPTRAA